LCRECVPEDVRCRQQARNLDTAGTSAPRAALGSLLNGAALSNVPDWLVRLVIRLVPSALLCAVSVVVVLGLIANGYLPR
jgi:hypothetical protein